MSYILDALRKAERERNLGQAPTLDTHYVVGSAAPRRVPLWLLIGGATLVVFLAVALTLSLRPEPVPVVETEAIPEVAVVDESEPAPPLPTAPTTETVTVQTADGPLQAELPVAPAETPPEALVEEPTAAQPATTPVEPAPPAESAPELAASEPEPPLEELPAGEPPEEAIGPDTPEEPAPIVPRGRARLDIPSYEGLPESIRGGMPALGMNAHVFSSTPGRGFVMINNRKYREGDVLAEGPEVVEILPEGVVLRFRGTDFLLPVPR